jgi:AAHS family 4-hydroxybenzoate transporter-like MFS transporter
MAGKRVSIAEIFDAGPFSPYQIWVCFLCFCVTFLDGFDLTVIGVALPKIADFLHSKPGALGLALSAGQVGPLIGAIGLGMLADRWGRKQMLFISAIIFGVFTMLTAYITSVEQLALFRFLAGIGLGGAVPNALAFGCEYAPTRMRATLTTTMYAGMAVGSVTAGLSAAYLLPHYGWQSLFFVGGLVPIVIGLLVAVLLPESLEFLVLRGKDAKQIRRIVSRIAPALVESGDVEFYSTEKKLPGAPVKHLFKEGRAFTTVLLWIAFFASFYLLWILLSWAPTLLRRSGATVQQYSLAFAGINLGSAVATITIGRVMDKSNPFNILKVAFILAFVSVAVFGLFAGSPFIVIAILSVITGFFVIGGNSGLMGLATVSYPPDIRGTGLGWAYGIGKMGAMVAPAMGGFLLSRNWSVTQICSTNALAALVVTAVVMILHRHVTSAAKSGWSGGPGREI